MTTETTDTTDGQVGRAASRAYAREFGQAMAAYVVVLAVVIAFGDLDGSAPVRFLWALLPLAPAGWALLAVQRHVRRVDEYQRGLLLQGLAVGFGAAMLAALTLGFLAMAGLELAAAPWVVYGAGMAGWAVASVRHTRLGGGGC